jgi:HlyD family secretion protein
MEAKNADLAALRINRSSESASAAPSPRGRVPRWLTIGLPAGVILALVGVFWITGGALRSAVPVHLTPATMMSPVRSGAVLIASGYVVAQRKAAVASKGTGRLVYLGVVEGDRVRAGQVIARIEDADVKAQLAQAQANLEVSRADLRDAENSLARERFLLDSGFTSRASFDAAQARYERVKAGIAVAQATVQAAQVALENTVIRAPFDGTVLTKNADVGEVVAPLAASAFSKSAVVTIADLSSLEVEADVAESNLEAVGVGQQCEIVLDAFPDVRYPARVAKIVPTADRAKATVQVKVAFRSYDSRVLPEMSAKVHFLPRPAKAGADTVPVLVVPSSAVTERNGRAVVYVVQNGRAVEVPVTVGRQVGTGVAIREGLAAGTQVIDSIGDRVRRGAKVKVE